MKNLRKVTASHVLICGLLLALVITLVAIGASVAPVAAFFVICLVMMGVMMWMMGSMGGGDADRR